jgi:prophage tail gpP-like protein
MDEMKIEIGGKSFHGWESFSLARTIDSCADGFSMTSIFDPDNQDILSAFLPFVYQDCIVKIDDEIILTGSIEVVSLSITDGNREINVQGRSKTGILVDCSIYDVGFQFDGLKLSAIAQKICQKHNINIIINNDSGTIAEARANPGDTIFEFLNKLAKDNGLMLSNDYPGNLVISKYEKGISVASIIEGDSPVKSVTGNYNGTQRFSIYNLLQQQDGTPDISGIANDNIKYRPKIITGATCEAMEITKAAEWARALAYAESIQISVALSEWRNDSGKLWTPGDTVTLLAPGAFILNETEFIIAESVLKMDVGTGRTTDLRLVLPATFTGEIPEVFPWE